ncbi:response regulator [Bacteroidota bacterium]
MRTSFKTYRAFFKQFSEKEINSIEKTSILFVDDEEDNLSLFKRVIKKSDLEIYTTLDPIEAIQMINKYSIDIISVDIRMPEMDGLELIEYIEKNIKTKKVILIISAFLEKRILVNNKKVNYHTFAGYIGKPFNYKYLLKLLTKYDLRIRRRKLFNKFKNS